MVAEGEQEPVARQEPVAGTDPDETGSVWTDL
jgi:hypothetical protein